VIADHLFLCAVNVLLAWSVYAALMAGQLSFASGAFMAIGCYVAGVLTTMHGWWMHPALLAGGAAAAVVGALVGFPALRVRGIYLILVTIGVSISTVVIIENIDYVGGPVGLAGMSGASWKEALAAVAVVGAALWAVSRTPLQRVLDAVREDDRVAASLGIDTVRVKVSAFAASAAIAGYAGGLYGHYFVFVRPDTFNVTLSIFAVLYVILGGVNNLWGALLGAVIMTLLPEYVVAFKEWRPTVFAAVIVILLLFRHEGLLTFRTVTARAAGAGAVR
jgi:branched-chain amino acid transport system permease protein